MDLETSIVANTDSILGNVAPIYNQIFGALIILIVGIILGRLLGILLDKFFREIQLDKAFNMFSRQTYSLGKAISDLFSFCVYLGSFIWALIFLNAFNVVFGFLLWLFLIIIFGSVILNAIEFLPNIYAGNLLRKNNYFKKDSFNFFDIKGVVKKFGFFRVNIISDSGDEYFISNKVLLNEIRKKDKN
ncbi:hypothetical protein K9M18_01895 [Candidatus Woesearchaeota archaeon]|nr:hypothetical protein [Candidatus Woesearchaeota archaeon]MCF8014037.1 hypothetical protein [Candidatus Woesearchaeota archaeon]